MAPIGGCCAGRAQGERKWARWVVHGARALNLLLRARPEVGSAFFRDVACGAWPRRGSRKWTRRAQREGQACLLVCDCSVVAGAGGQVRVCADV